MGSTRDARHAGTVLAASATTASRAATAVRSAHHASDAKEQRFEIACERGGTGESGRQAGEASMSHPRRGRAQLAAAGWRPGPGGRRSHAAASPSHRHHAVDADSREDDRERGEYSDDEQREPRVGRRVCDVVVEQSDVSHRAPGAKLAARS